MSIKVSVIIPTYNRAEFISDAIESVLNQTFEDYEIIIVDDGSTDNTKQIVQSYTSKVKYYYQEQSGVSSARNYGIKAATGEYIAFLDSDDQFLPQKLEKQVEVLENNPRIGIVYSPHIIWHPESDEKKVSRTRFLSGFQPRKMLDMCMSGPFTVPTVMIPKRVFDEVGN